MPNRISKRSRARRCPPQLGLGYDLFDDRQIMPFAVWCWFNDVSPRTGRRILASGNGPRVTQISARRIGVTYGDNRAWQESRARGKFQKNSEAAAPEGCS